MAGRRGSGFAGRHGGGVAWAAQQWLGGWLVAWPRQRLDKFALTIFIQRANFALLHLNSH
jgi:hypothetical protein